MQSDWFFHPRGTKFQWRRSAYVSMRNNLVVSIDCRILRQRKSHSFIPHAARTGHYRRVDSDYLSRHIHKGPTGISRINRRVRLKKSLELAAGCLELALIAIFRAHNPAVTVAFNRNGLPIATPNLQLARRQNFPASRKEVRDSLQS